MQACATIDFLRRFAVESDQPLGQTLLFHKNCLGGLVYMVYQAKRQTLQQSEHLAFGSYIVWINFPGQR